jgi:tripartite-type tricarboxylate transporter receptor subunit TctC
VKQLVALAKSQPGRMNFSSGGNGVGIHMAGELFKVAARVQIVHVPYKGAANAMTALMAGEVDMMFNGLSPSLPIIKSGKLQALAVGGPKRSVLVPDLPTVLESGFDFNTEGWYGVVAPKGTPASVVNVLHQTLVEAMGAKEMNAQLAKHAIEGGATTPAEFANLIREENARWAKVIKAAGIKMH